MIDFHQLGRLSVKTAGLLDSLGVNLARGVTDQARQLGAQSATLKPPTPTAVPASAPAGDRLPQPINEHLRDLRTPAASGAVAAPRAVSAPAAPISPQREAWQQLGTYGTPQMAAINAAERALPATASAIGKLPGALSQSHLGGLLGLAGKLPVVNAGFEVADAVGLRPRMLGGKGIGGFGWGPHEEYMDRITPGEGSTFAGRLSGLRDTPLSRFTGATLNSGGLPLRGLANAPQMVGDAFEEGGNAIHSQLEANRRETPAYGQQVGAAGARASMGDPKLQGLWYQNQQGRMQPTYKNIGDVTPDRWTRLRKLFPDLPESPVDYHPAQ